MLYEKVFAKQTFAYIGEKLIIFCGIDIDFWL